MQPREGWRFDAAPSSLASRAMAIPVLYWMLECSGCGTRRVVLDSYLEFIGTPKANRMPGTGDGGKPLHERYGCAKGCAQPMKTIGFKWDRDDEEMWLDEPYVLVKLTSEQTNEWRQLIEAAGLYLPGTSKKERWMAAKARYEAGPGSGSV